ncbi:threonine-phosphate decarboxylase CobD [Sinorhizobium alkalisoli]|uniref:threonine-phosphate decarboxylase CobD n=1 Tax=Sinorhizobium alkalisoli TaxID=1752398 RepID=UPI00124BF4CC|nr:threonine-phosphate decarboxylase CobD [Sinorhizobium alkalisoli]MCA1493845.1 threonine-phosphate decarboxylase [Ensifer sp. NBAIM29]MCG5480652.1 threonine-phosphate decarboxylase [Sinorhizobium alkalisoli]QFI66746.1 L-threonine 3-O-phosphate decarboxylase [Sinorhizobium alkalisoli]
MTAPLVHGGGISEAAARFGGAPEDWLDLSTGINPCPVTIPEIDPRVWHRLPDKHLEQAARVAASRYYRTGDLPPLPVPGTQAAIQLLPPLAGSAGRAAILAPTYGEYARVLQAGGMVVDLVETVDDLAAAPFAVIVNPNNPTGRHFQPEQILAVAEAMAARGGLLVVDEAFGDLYPAASVAPHVADHDNLVVFRSFGKFFGLAGLRLGFVIATAPVLESLRERLGPWAVSGPALALSAKLMAADTGAVAKRIWERKAGLDAVLAGAGLKVIGGTGLFALVEHERAQALHEDLCGARILTRKFDYNPHWLRLGPAADEHGDLRLAEALKGAGV